MFSVTHASWRPQRDRDHPRCMDLSSEPEAPRDYHQESPLPDDDLIEFRGQSPLPIPRAAVGSSLELTARFARALSLKDTRNDQLFVLRRSARAKSKSCASEKKLGKRRLEQLRSRHHMALRASIAHMQNELAALERSRNLADTRSLLWRTNRTAAVVRLCHEYFFQFAQGYSTRNMVQHETTRSFVYSIAEQDLLCREYCGVDKFLEQWEIYTMFHGDFQCRLLHLALADQDDNVVSVHCQAELDLEISDATLRNLYPEFYALAQSNAKSKQTADGLIGKRYIMAFDKVLHFNGHGKLFAHESKVHLASSLLGVLKNPFAAMEMLQGSAMTVDGHWKTTDVDYMRVEQDEMLEMPKLIL